MRRVTAYAQQLAPWTLERDDRPRWVQLRRQGLGGSDMPGVTGMSERKSRWAIWVDKIAGDDEPDTGDAAEGSRLAEMFWFGHQMEAVAARRFRLLNPGAVTTRCGMIARIGEPWMRVNLDYLVRGCPAGGRCILEIKNRSAWVASQWDPHGDAEQVPDDAVVQTMWGLIVLGRPAAGYTHGHLLAVIGGNELRPYRIDYDPELAHTLVSEGRWFWRDHVLPAVPPPVDASEHTGRVMARLWDVEPDKIKVADPAIVKLDGELRDAEAEQDAASDRVRLLRHELQAWLGDAEVALHPEGYKLFTWRQNSTFRDGDFRAEQPELAAEYTRTAEVTDIARLKEHAPDVYRAYRARQFRPSAPPRDRTRS